MRDGFASDAYKAIHALPTRRVYTDVDGIPFSFERVPLKVTLAALESLRTGRPVHVSEATEDAR